MLECDFPFFVSSPWNLKSLTSSLLSGEALGVSGFGSYRLTVKRKAERPAAAPSTDMLRRYAYHYYYYYYLPPRRVLLHPSQLTFPKHARHPNPGIPGHENVRHHSCPRWCQSWKHPNLERLKHFAPRYLHVFKERTAPQHNPQMRVQIRSGSQLQLS